MRKIKLSHLFLIFLVLEIGVLVITAGLNKEIQIGKIPGKGATIRLADKPFNLQKKITEEFQIDKYEQDERAEHIAAGHHAEPLTIYGSQGLYNFFAKIFKTNPIGTFKLLRMLFITDLAMLLLAWLIARALMARPGKSQILFEMIYSTLEGFVEETLGPKMLKFTPYIVTIFLFIWVCNMIGLIPVPGFMEPTRNLNVPLGMGIMVVVVVHVTAIRVLGFKNYIMGYMTPLGILDVIGEVAKGVSIAFRLFGNILGGAIIILVVSSLVKFVLLPVGLSLFFGIFVGTVQAFVFTMLALSYISVAIAEE